MQSFFSHPHLKLPFLSASLFALGILLTGCGDSSESGNRKSDDGFPRENQIEVRDDGLAYRKGDTQPYTGIVINRDKEWNPRYFASYENGKLHGSEMRWYDDGRLKRSYDYSHGEKIRHREWFENGNPKIDAMMKDGVAFGRHTKWYEDGNLRFDGEFLENLQWHGRVQDIAPDGTVLWDATFDHGRYVSGTYPESEKQNLIDAGLLEPPASDAAQTPPPGSVPPGS